MDLMFWIWLGVLVVSIIVEIFTLKLISIWFAFGGIIPFILSIFKINFIIEIVVFVVVSLLLVFAVRKYAQKFLFGTVISQMKKINKDLSDNLQTEPTQENNEDDEIIIPKKPFDEEN